MKNMRFMSLCSLRITPWAYHSSGFEVTRSWRTFEINFDEFEKKSGMSPQLYPNNIRDMFCWLRKRI